MKEKDERYLRKRSNNTNLGDERILQKEGAITASNQTLPLTRCGIFTLVAVDHGTSGKAEEACMGILHDLTRRVWSVFMLQYFVDVELCS